MTFFEQAVQQHYAGEVTAARSFPAHILDRVRAARAKAVCAGCDQPISVQIEARVLNAMWYHPSCAARAVVEAREVPPSVPTIIGTLHGAAISLNQPCYIEHHQGSEIFEAGAFNRALAYPERVTLRVGHQGADVPGRMRLGMENFELRFCFDVQDSAAGRAVLEQARRGAFDGCSIQFLPRPGDGSYDEHGRRRWRDVDLQHIAAIPRGGRPSWYATWIGVV